MSYTASSLAKVPAFAYPTTNKLHVTLMPCCDQYMRVGSTTTTFTYNNQHGSSIKSCTGLGQKTQHQHDQLQSMTSHRGHMCTAVQTMNASHPSQLLQHAPPRPPTFVAHTSWRNSSSSQGAAALKAPAGASGTSRAPGRRRQQRGQMRRGGSGCRARAGRSRTAWPRSTAVHPAVQQYMISHHVMLEVQE